MFLQTVQSSSTQIEWPPFFESALFDDAVDLFTGMRRGHVGRYSYSEPLFSGDPVRGNELWASFVRQHRAYYPYYDEVKLIKRCLPELVNLCDDTRHFVELGAGSIEAFNNKTLPLIKALGPESYTVADICEHSAEEATERLNKILPRISVQQSIGDFFQSLPYVRPHSLMFLVGCTIGNNVVDWRYENGFVGLVRALRHFAAALRCGGHLVFTYDSNHDEVSLHRAYTHHYLDEMELVFLRCLERDLPSVKLNIQDFRHRVGWYPTKHLLAQEVEVIRDTTILLGGYTFHLQAGQKLHNENCFKYTDDMVMQAATAAGFVVTKLFSQAESPMRLAVLRSAC